jgi:hypothetical protein
MKEVPFDPNGPDLFINILYQISANSQPNLAAVYTYQLWENNSSAILDMQKGNNMNDDDDKYGLPTPVHKNHRRIIDILSTLSNFGSDNLNMRILIEVFQDGQLIDQLIVPYTLPGNTTTADNSFIRLIAKPEEL